MTLLAVLLGAAAGAIGFRIRGGYLGDRSAWWHEHGQASRLAYAALMAAVTLLSGWPWPEPTAWHVILLAAFLVAAWFAGAVLWSTFGTNDMSRNEGAWIRDFLLASLRGALYALPAAVVVFAYRMLHGAPQDAWAALAMPAAGLFLGLALETAWRIRPRHEQRPTELGELIAGAFLGAGAALAGVLA